MKDGCYVFTEEQKEALRELIQHLKKQSELYDKFIKTLEEE